MLSALDSHKVYEVQSRMDSVRYIINSQSCPNIFSTLSAFCSCEDNVDVLSPTTTGMPPCRSTGSSPREDRDSGVDVGRVTEDEDEEEGMVQIYKDEGVETMYKPLYMRHLHLHTSQVI